MLHRKSYASPNAYKAHLNSKRHKENVIKGAAAAVIQAASPASETPPSKTSTVASPSQPAQASSEKTDIEPTGEPLSVEEEIAKRLASAPKLTPTDCLFCPTSSQSAEENADHMSHTHSTFIPDKQYLVDLPGLLGYLAEKAAIGWTCLWCSAQMRGLEGVRGHMKDKSHMKIAWDDEMGEFYDFRSSYPDHADRPKKSKPKSETVGVVEEEDDEDEDMEDVDEDDEEGEGWVDVPSESESDEDDLPLPDVAYGATQYELVLPSGTRIKHRHSNHPSNRPRQEPRINLNITKRIEDDKNKESRGMTGLAVVAARNPGSVKHATSHIRQFRDMQKREQFKTKVGFRHNSQKHFRDPLLQ